MSAGRGHVFCCQGMCSTLQQSSETQIDSCCCSDVTNPKSALWQKWLICLPQERWQESLTPALWSPPDTHQTRSSGVISPWLRNLWRRDQSDLHTWSENAHGNDWLPWNLEVFRGLKRHFPFYYKRFRYAIIFLLACTRSFWSGKVCFAIRKIVFFSVMLALLKWASVWKPFQHVILCLTSHSNWAFRSCCCPGNMNG